MRTLVIECATEACSVAWHPDGYPMVDGEERRGEFRHEVLGRGHAERLVPMIAELPERGRAERILVSLGPGSFTGVRIGLATARALGLAWGAQVLGYPTLQLVAQMDVAFGPLELLSCENPNPPDFLVCMSGGHGEWFVQPFSPAREPLGPVRSLPPHEAIDLYSQPVVVGSRAGEFVARRGAGKAFEALPNALYAWSLPAGYLTSNLTPIYGRPPDARLPT